jgi:hypothetical protein
MKFAPLSRQRVIPFTVKKSIASSLFAAFFCRFSFRRELSEFIALTEQRR